MDCFFRQIFQELLLSILKLIDGVTQVFNIIMGIEGIDLQGNDGTPVESVSLVDWFLGQDVIVQIFLTLFVVSVILIAVCCIAAIIKSMFHSGNGERKPATRVIGQGLRSLITTVFVGIITFFAIGGANTLLVTVNKVFTGNNEKVTISKVILELGLIGGDTLDLQTMEYIRWYQINGELKSDTTGVSEQYANQEDNVKKVLKSEMDGGKGNIWDTTYDVWRWHIMKNVPVGADGRVGVRDTEKFNDLFDGRGYLKSGITAKDVWGTYSGSVFFGASWSNNGALYGDTYDALMPYIAAFILLYIMTMTSFSLVKRLFDIISLFFVLPFVNATVPLDDGAHIKLWRETMISKVVLAYGAVFALGVFYLFAPLCNKVMIAGNGTLTSVIRLILVGGSGLAVQGGMLLFSRLVGTGIAESGEMGQTARTLLAAGAGATMLGVKAVSAAGGWAKGKYRSVKDKIEGEIKADEMSQRYNPTTTQNGGIGNILRGGNNTVNGKTDTASAAGTGTVAGAATQGNGQFTPPAAPPTAPLNPTAPAAPPTAPLNPTAPAAPPTAPAAPTTTGDSK